MSLPVVTSSARYREQQEYYDLGRSLSGEASLQGPVRRQTAADLLLQIQDEERRTRDSSLKRETAEHTTHQAHVRHHLTTKGQGSFLHTHQEQAEPLHHLLRCHGRVHLHGGRGP